MKKNFLIFGGLTALFLITSCGPNEEISRKKTFVDFDLISTIKLNDSIRQKQSKPRGFVIVKEEQLRHLLNNNSREIYYDFRDNIDYSVFDFSKFDYIISRGSEIDSLSHSEYYTKTMDFCKDKSRKALEVKHKPAYNSSSLFIYKLKEKNKYRSPCG